MQSSKKLLTVEEVKTDFCQDPRRKRAYQIALAERLIKAVRTSISDTEFASFVSDVIEAGVTTREIADEHCVSISTVQRWARGESAPHPIGRQPAIDSLVFLLQKHKAKLKAST